MKKNLDLSVFIPCYNEQRIIGKHAKLILNELNRLSHLMNYSFELIFVNDASCDNTLKILNYFEKQNKNVRIINYPYGPTGRENLVKSFKLARGNKIIFMDADLSTDLKDLSRLITFLDNYDLVIGNRYLPESKSQRTIYRRVTSFFFNILIRLLFNSNIKDNFAGFKGFNRKVLFSLLEKTGTGIKGRRIMWDAEVLIRAKRAGYSIYELPISWKEGKKSALRINREISMIPYIFKLRFRI